ITRVVHVFIDVVRFVFIAHPPMNLFCMVTQYFNQSRSPASTPNYCYFFYFQTHLFRSTKVQINLLSEERMLINKEQLSFYLLLLLLLPMHVYSNPLFLCPIVYYSK